MITHVALFHAGMESISIYLRIKGTVNRTLKRTQVQNYTRLTTQSTVPLPTLLYSCKIWDFIEQDKTSIKAKRTWKDYKTNEDIL